MAGGGRISLLVSEELQTLVTVARTLDRNVAAQLRKRTRGVAEQAWRDEVRGRVSTRLQTRVLSDTAKVSVSDTNVLRKSAVVGKLSTGTPASALAGGAEFGVGADKQVRTRSRTGTSYTRRQGGAFGPPRRQGNVVFPAVRASGARLAALWLQTAFRTVAETFEKGA